MKTMLMGFLILLMPLVILAQDEKEYRLNEYFEITAKKQYTYKRVIKKENDVWICSDYDRKGQLVQLAHYHDENLRYREGYYVFYEGRKKHYEGHYKSNKPIGVWYFYQPYGILADSINYEFYKKAVIPPSVTKLTGNTRRSEEKMDTTANMKRDTSGTFQRVEKEAMFPGGFPGWKKYLEKNLLPRNIPYQVYSSVKEGTVQVKFVVCTDGAICNVETINSVHPLVDWYAVRTIRNGPGWVPGEQNNRKVKSYHTQPITFFFDFE